MSKWTDSDGNTYDIVTRLPAERRSDLASLGELMIATGRTAANGAPLMVRLDQVADIGIMPAPPKSAASTIAERYWFRPILPAARLAT